MGTWWKWGFPNNDKWYKCKPEILLESKGLQIFSVQADKKKKMENRLVIKVVEKMRFHCQMAGPSYSFDTDVENKGDEKRK